MRILLTIHERFLPDSGSAGSTFRLGEEYERLGHEVTIFSLDNMPNLQRQVRRFVFPEFVAAHVGKLHKQQRLDVVDGAPGDNWIWGSLSRFLGPQRPVVVTRSHGLQHLEHLWHLEEARQKRLKLSWFYPIYRGGFQLWEIENSIQFADLVFLLNKQEATYVRQHFKVDPGKLHVFPNGMPRAFMGLDLHPIPEAADAKIRIAHIGTYIQRKGIEYSVPALKTILKRYPNVEVSFIGTGFTELEAPEQLVYSDFESEYHPRIRVIPQYQHEHLPTLLKDHHIDVFPSLSEGFGKALIEAMACGLAPITTDADGPMEIVRNNHDALVVPKRDSAAIENALERLITHQTLLHTIRANAYETAQQYSWSAIAKRRLELYEKALHQR